ncbi:MAG: hypothetical protein RLN81_09330, partial [Balneolaceae bacterium]
MAYRYLQNLTFLFIFGIVSSVGVFAQEGSYRFTPAPDIWYNDVDGVRLGLRVLGEVEGTFKDGPHRLDAGVWLSTWLPDNPVSYYASFTEPIGTSDLGNETSIGLISSIRTGYSRHSLNLNKRWQDSFSEYEYKEVVISFAQEKMFDAEYRPFRQLWQNKWKSLIGLDFVISSLPEIGQFLGKVSVKQNVGSNVSKFTIGSVELLQKVDLNEMFKLRIRGFAGFASEDTAPEYLFISSMNSPQNWIGSGLTRAKGTVPETWLQAGSFQVGGGANLRGYLNADINALNAGLNPSFRSIWSINTELEFPNPIDNKLRNISIVGDLISFRSYLFVDIGQGSESVTGADTDVLSDAGTGFQLSINIPDYLGKDRGIFIRYDIPFWLSEPGGDESNFSFRQLIGVGAI